MGRLFIVFIIFIASMYLVKYIRSKVEDSLKERKLDDKRGPKSENELNSTKDNSKKLMVKCQFCGLHIPEKEAIKQGDKTFCSLEHAKKGL